MIMSDIHCLMTGAWCLLSDDDEWCLLTGENVVLLTNEGCMVSVVWWGICAACCLMPYMWYMFVVLCRCVVFVV